MNEAMQERLKEIGAELADALKEEAQDFVVDNKDDALLLGEETVKAILSDEAWYAMPIPELPENVTLDMLAEREAVLAQRDKTLQLIAAAQRVSSEAVARVRGKAKAVAVKVGGLILGLGIKGLLGI